MTTPLYRQLASLLQAIENCETTGNTEWRDKHYDRMNNLVNNHMPSGSGFDSGTTLTGESTPDRLVFHTSFHHMDEAGGYDGWTEHNVIVTASLQFGYEVRVTGKDRNSIKEYIAEEFSGILDTEIL